MWTEGEPEFPVSYYPEIEQKARPKKITKSREKRPRKSLWHGGIKT